MTTDIFIANISSKPHVLKTLNRQWSNWWGSLMIKHYQQMILFSQASVCSASANSQHELQPWIHAVRLVTAGCSGSLTACQLAPAWDARQARSDRGTPQAHELCAGQGCTLSCGSRGAADFSATLNSLTEAALCHIPPVYGADFAW